MIIFKDTFVHCSCLVVYSIILVYFHVPGVQGSSVYRTSDERFYGSDEPILTRKDLEEDLDDVISIPVSSHSYSSKADRKQDQLDSDTQDDIESIHLHKTVVDKNGNLYSLVPKSFLASEDDKPIYRIPHGSDQDELDPEFDLDFDGDKEMGSNSEFLRRSSYEHDETDNGNENYKRAPRYNIHSPTRNLYHKQRSGQTGQRQASGASNGFRGQLNSDPQPQRNHKIHKAIEKYASKNLIPVVISHEKTRIKAKKLDSDDTDEATELEFDPEEDGRAIDYRVLVYPVPVHPLSPLYKIPVLPTVKLGSNHDENGDQNDEPNIPRFKLQFPSQEEVHRRQQRNEYLDRSTHEEDYIQSAVEVRPSYQRYQFGRPRPFGWPIRMNVHNRRQFAE